MFERLDGGFVSGYTKAIMDIMDVFNYIEDDLRWHKKKITSKTVKEILKCFLENRETFREDQTRYFMRWNCKENKFEVVMDKRWENYSKDGVYIGGK